MKLPKFKGIKKLTKVQKLRIGQVVSMLVYTVGITAYGVLNYMEGEEVEWKHIAEKADGSPTGCVILHDGDVESRDNMYWVAGRDMSKEMWDELEARKKDEQDS